MPLLPTRRRAASEASSKRPRETKEKVLEILPNQVRNQFIAFIGEYVGTFLFLFFAFSGTQVANAAANNANTVTPELSGAADTSVVLYIALSFGFSLCVNAWVFFRISGGLFNPAVTLALALVGAIKPIRAVFVFLAQVLGGITAAGIVAGLLPGPMAVSTTLGQGTRISQGLFIEMFATFQLVFTIIMLAAEKHKSTYLAPVGIGLSLFISELAAVPFTGGSLNPARSFGPAVVLRTFPGYHWIYWLGPTFGALLAVALYKMVKILEYETANPGQDFDDQEDAIFQAQNAQRAGSTSGSADPEKGLVAAEFGDHGPTTKEEVMRPVVGLASPGLVTPSGMDFTSQTQLAGVGQMRSMSFASQQQAQQQQPGIENKTSMGSIGPTGLQKQQSLSSMGGPSTPQKTASQV